jgi:hypothetical protein
VSYDYFLFARPADGNPPTLESLASAARPIGTPQQLMARISALFPAVAWEPPRGDVEAWFGVNGPEFLLSPDADGNVSALKAAYIERAEVRALAAALELVAFDPQKGRFVDA